MHAAAELIRATGGNALRTRRPQITIATAAMQNLLRADRAMAASCTPAARIQPNPGEYHLPDGVAVGFPAWMQHFFKCS